MVETDGKVCYTISVIQKGSKTGRSLNKVYYFTTIIERENTGKVLLFSPAGEAVHLFLYEGTQK